MKKRAFLFAIFAVFSLTSCDLLNNLNFNGPRKRSSREQESEVFDDSVPNSERSSSSKQTTSKHVHTYGEWVMVKAPTCTDVGVEESRCECGKVQTRKIQALGHSFDEFLYNTATCDDEGYEAYRCTRCGAITEVPVKGQHRWGEETFYDSTNENYVAYNMAECDVCHKTYISIRAVEGTLENGAMIKSGTPEGFMKLSKNNSSISWTFSLDIPAGYSSYIGTVYQRAFMDSFSANTQRTYGSYTTSSSATTEEGNFRLEVNDQIVDKSQYMNMTYEELTAGGDDSSFLGDNYSPIGLCPIGQVMLIDGVNTMRYTRLGSYNLTISDFVFIVSLSGHSHAATSEWYHDDNYHWHGCSAPGCPVDGGAKFDMALHSWSERYEEVASTCQTVGSYKQQCTVCGYVRTVEVPTTAHNYGDWVVVKEATCSEDGLKQRVCLICGLEENQAIKADHQYDAIVSHSFTSDWIATTGYQCSGCGKYALRWSALDYDVGLSTPARYSDYVRFDSGQVENLNGSPSTGSRLVYKVNVGYAQNNASLSFRIKNTNGNGSNAPVFATIPNDSYVGYIDNGDGTYRIATHRYGLRVNGVEYFLGSDNYGSQPAVTGWFDWPVTFSIKAGVNTIEVFAYASYRAYIYDFQLTADNNFFPRDVDYDIPVGSYYGIGTLADNTQVPIWLEFNSGNNYGSITVGDTTCGAVVTTINTMNGVMSVTTDSFGILGCHYDNWDDIYIGNLNEYLKDTVILVKTFKHWNLDGTSEELNSQFVPAMYANGGWGIDDYSGTHLVQDNVNAKRGSAMRFVPYEGRYYNLVCRDFDERFESHNLSFWVYNPSTTEVLIKVVINQDLQYCTQFEVSPSGGISLPAGGWTFVSIPFQERAIYSYQIEVYNDQSVSLTFDDMVLL